MSQDEFNKLVDIFPAIIFFGVAFLALLITVVNGVICRIKK